MDREFSEEFLTRFWQSLSLVREGENLLLTVPWQFGEAVSPLSLCFTLENAAVCVIDDGGATLSSLQGRCGSLIAYEPLIDALLKTLPVTRKGQVLTVRYRLDTDNAEERHLHYLNRLLETVSLLGNLDLLENGRAVE